MNNQDCNCGGEHRQSDPVVSEPIVVRNLNILAQNINELRVLVTALYEKLAPVMKPLDSKGEEEGGFVYGNSPLANDISHQTDNIRDVNLSLANIINRLEV